MVLPRIKAFYYEWPGTKDNHAGMAYFAKRLKKDIGLPISLVCNSPRDYKKINFSKHYARLTMPWTDCLFFKEYLSPIGIACQENVALRLRQWGVKKPMTGLMHLPESLLLKNYKLEYIRSSLDALDHIIVYGSSLTRFLEKIGYGHKVKETFHYVDSDYYHPVTTKKDKIFNVIFCGFLLRNVDILKQIVEQCPKITFQICGGIADLKALFGNTVNVKLYGYLPEDELLEKLQQADASISVMEDTIGSNAIVCGLACGLPQIVSDVGSIRDYCSEENSIFCKNVDDFVKAVQLLSQNKDLCHQMKLSARQRAEELSISKSIDWFKNFFININEKK